MTLRRVHAGDVLAGLGGVALLAVMFAPWYHFLEGVYTGTRTIAPGDETQSAWEALTVLRFALAATALLGIVQLATTLFERTPAWPVAAEVFGVAIGIITTIWLVIRLLNPPGDNFAADLRWGAWVGLVCCVATLAGAYWSLRAEERP
jgi:hypothetical protein